MKSDKFHLRIEHLWGLAVLVGIFVFISTHPIRPHDFWWHITVGREIITTGKIPSLDTYSYTAAGQPYPSYKMFWLMEILLYEIYILGGPALVIFIYSLIIFSAYGIIFWLCKEISKSWRIAALGLFFAAALGLNDWNVRPQGITFLFASLYLLAIHQYRKGHSRVWLVTFPLGMLVWVNSHGSFIIGLVLLGIWLGQEIWTMLREHYKNHSTLEWGRIAAQGMTLIVTALACFGNPGGIGVINYLKTLTGNSVIQNLVTEWAPPAFNTLMGILFFIGLIGTAIILVVSPKRPDFYQTFAFLIFGVLGLRTSRGSVWFGLIMAPILAEHISYIVQRFQKAERELQSSGGSKLINASFVVLLCAMAVISLPWFKSALPFPQAKAGLISAETPVEATRALLELKPPGQVFNAMSFGSYLIWAAYPQYQVFIDSRIELFSEKIWRDYLAISNADAGWEALVDGYEVKTLMLSPTEQAGLVGAVQANIDWYPVYQDQSAVIFMRK